MTEPRVPSSLLLAVGRDLRSVRPLASPERRALGMLPLGLLLLLGVPLVWGWRHDLAALGPLTSWGLSSLELGAGLLLLLAAFRQVVPGRELAPRSIRLLVGAALAVFTGLTLTTAHFAAANPALDWRDAWECLEIEMLASVPAFVAAVWLASRALASRPALAGALYGMSAGLLADSGVRLFCPVSSLAHVLLGHGGAILLLAGAGALLAVVIERRRPRLRAPQD